MKAQGLPMTTIILVIIAVVALVVVVLFFFGAFEGGKDSSSTFLDIGSNKTNEARCQATLLGSPCTDPTKSYCDPTTGECVASCTDANEDKICD